MSAGFFSKTKYQASYGAGTSIHPIRIQPESALATIGSVANTAPTGAVNNPITASVSGSKRSNRLISRRVVIQLDGDPPAGYDERSVVYLPALTPTFYNAAVVGAAVTYLEKTWKVLSRRQEFPS